MMAIQRELSRPRQIKGLYSAALTALCCVTGLARSADATPAVLLSYIASTVASGKLNGVAFANAVVSLGTTAYVPPATHSSSGFYEVSPASPMSVSVAGLGSGTFTDVMYLFDYQPNSGVGFSDGGLGDILDDGAPAFGTYAFQTPIGPVVGSPGYNSIDSFPTTAGPLVLSFVSLVQFTAAAVPELAATAALMLVILLFRRRRK